jgi:hypothetical protein
MSAAEAVLEIAIGALTLGRSLVIVNKEFSLHLFPHTEDNHVSGYTEIRLPGTGFKRQVAERKKQI